MIFIFFESVYRYILQVLAQTRALSTLLRVCLLLHLQHMQQDTFNKNN
jgi:hypothetical protein